ncbi:hypothetical protein HYALB_00002501 [Hymenoscyphus albidus]|uniref:O-methyltransferase dimerisation domain-containing protein n=1 Tax=Hymenoscyphus albidus TaxID=595503 RepID=A0A9N9LUK1_9HELO|nr:hypothetical protein HYALB_00002501 [Hymenoscyphus albidus]
MTDIESLISQIRDAAKTADLSLRFKLSMQLQSLAHSIATPEQIMQHYGYIFTEQLVARIAAYLDIFTILAQSEGALKVGDIAVKTGADPLLLDRILRHLAATYTINEVGESTFAANDATKLLASPVGWGNLMFGCNILNKAFQELPKLLKEIKTRTLTRLPIPSSTEPMTRSYLSLYSYSKMQKRSGTSSNLWLHSKAPYRGQQ